MSLYSFNFKGNDKYYVYPKLYIYVREVECILKKKENHKQDYHLACDECYPVLKEKIIDVYQSYCKKDNDFKNFDNPFCFDDTKKEVSIHLSKNWAEDELTLAYVLQNSCDNDSNQEQSEALSEALSDYNDIQNYLCDGDHEDLSTLGSLIKELLKYNITQTKEMSPPENKNIFRFMNDILKITGCKFEHSFSWCYDCSCDSNEDEFNLLFSYNDKQEFPKTELTDSIWCDHSSCDHGS
tara:strand:- start:1492 stop:2208 length:717 start_codon:yes stop_codon:yes gene_type:complete